MKHEVYFFICTVDLSEKLGLVAQKNSSMDWLYVRAIDWLFALAKESGGKKKPRLVLQ